MSTCGMFGHRWSRWEFTRHYLDVSYREEGTKSSEFARECKRCGLVKTRHEYGHIHEPKPAKDMAGEVARIWDERWCDWLASNGYGITIRYPLSDPPCSIRDLAEAYHRTNPTNTVDQWETTLRAELGATA